MRACLLLLLLRGALPGADPIAAAGPDRALIWPEVRVDLAGVAANGTAQWYQVSGPATARLRDATSAATTVALPQVGTYVFRLQVSGGGATASDDVTVTLAARPALDGTATAVDHLLANVAPMPKAGTRMRTLNRHDFGIPASIAVPLATRWGYSWLINVDEGTDAKMSNSGWPEYAYAQAWAANPGRYSVTALYQHVVENVYTTRPQGWPDSAFVCDASGTPIDFDAGTAVRYYLSPLAPDSIFTSAGQRIGGCIVRALQRRGITVSAVADQGEWGLGVTGHLSQDGELIYRRDPAIVAAVNASTVAAGSFARFVSIQAARQNRLVRDAVYQAAGLATSVPWYGYSDTGFSIDRGRWGGWAAWATYLEDCNPWLDLPSEEFYVQGDDWTTTDGGGTPTDYMTRLLNVASGQRAVRGRSRMIPWASAGGWSPETNPTAGLCPRPRYTGFLKMAFTCGAVGIFQDDYGFDQRIRNNTAIGSQPTTQVWGWMDAAHVHALFSHYDDIVWDGELVASALDHPYRADPTAPRKLMAFRPSGDNAAWVAARKAAGADRWLITAFATSGSDRTVSVTILGPGTVQVRARAAGSVYLAERQSDGSVLLDWLDEQDPLQPTRLWFSAGRGVPATAPPSAIAPVITTHPISRSVVVGQSVSFTVAASGTPAPTFQWQRRASGASTWSPINGAISATYTLTTALVDSGAAFRAVATNSAGSATSNAATLTVSSAPRPVQINFQPAAAPTVTGYAVDSGEAFSSTRGYGWTPGIADTARDRNVLSDQLRDTLVHTQKPGLVASWKLALPAGTYQVTLGVGDPSYVDSVYRFAIEGQRVVDFTPTSATRMTTVTQTIAITDGFLDLTNASGAMNNKIQFIEVVPAATAPSGNG